MRVTEDDSGEEWSDDDESPYGDSTPPSVDDDEELLSSSWHRAMHMKDGPDHDDPHKVVNLHWDPTFREVAYDKNAKPTKSILLKESRKTDRQCVEWGWNFVVICGLGFDGFAVYFSLFLVLLSLFWCYLYPFAP